MLVNLYKKNSSYMKDGEEKKVTNFYLGCGDTVIPIEAKYFEDKETGKDPGYASRRTVLSAFAEILPEKKPKSAE